MLWDVLLENAFEQGRSLAPLGETDGELLREALLGHCKWVNKEAQPPQARFHPLGVGGETAICAPRPVQMASGYVQIGLKSVSTRLGRNETPCYDWLASVPRTCLLCRYASKTGLFGPFVGLAVSP